MNYHEAKLHYLLLFKELKDIDVQLIATDSYYSYLYARYVLKGRFEPGETAIARDYFYTIYYNELLREQGINFELQ